MAKKRSGTTPESTFRGAVLPPAGGLADSSGAETTGRFVVIFNEGAADAATVRSTLRDVTGLKNIATSSDYEGAISADDFTTNEVTHFEKLGIAIVSEGDPMQALSASVSNAESPILAIEPEYIARLSASSGNANPGIGHEYLRGYKDAVNHLYDQLTGSGDVGPSEVADLLNTFQDTAQFTWGLQATGVSTSPFNGQGIKVAILDTGFDFLHPDYRGRSIISETFSGFPVQDIHGHGTHCVGTACGPQRPFTGVRRYGVACNAQILVGKVFNNDNKPGAETGNVIKAIEWALTNGCQVASLSLGIEINQQVLQYDVPIQRALNAGMLIVAAAGNNARRPGNPGFVESPANAEAALAVAALDSRLGIAPFSAQSSQVTGVGGKVNIAGPGVAIFSSVPATMGTHDSFNGTSMATPHVAGIAALWAQATGDSGAALWTRLTQAARPLNLPSVDVGDGLVQAPQ